MFKLAPVGHNIKYEITYLNLYCGSPIIDLHDQLLSYGVKLVSGRGSVVFE